MLGQHKAPMNRYGIWRYILIILITVFGILYALPNYFGENPAVQISAQNGAVMTAAVVNKVEQSLKSNHVDFQSVTKSKYNVLIKFANTSDQMKGQDAVVGALGKNYVVALNFAPNTPHWLEAIGSYPMKYGLDLRGGMYFLLDIDMQSVLHNQLENYASTFRKELRQKHIRYSGVKVKGEQVQLSFRSADYMAQARTYIKDVDPALIVSQPKTHLQLNVSVDPQMLKQTQQYALQQTIQVMRNRVNELGVGDASVSQQGLDRVVIELPGLQDAARAKQIIGGTATLKVMLVNEKADIQNALNGIIPIGSSLYYTTERQGHIPYVLYNRVIITGKSFVGASVGYDQQTSLPVVNVKLSGPDVSYFSKVTGENINHKMAIVLVQPRVVTKMLNGKTVKSTVVTQKIISAANIMSRLGNSFQISGIGSARNAQILAMTIRAGSLPAPVSIAEERLIGPTLGAENIKKGAISVAVALLAVIVFMAIYYRLLGLIANFALVLNLILIVAVMSVIPGATLTLPGIAGIVLNLGMAIDANVLIFERIREELRNKATVQAAIHAGYERAFGTIVDSNVTTLIVAIILYAVGTGPVKGFAVTLIIGIIISMFTAITVTRALVNLIYGGRVVKKLSIGI